MAIQRIRYQNALLQSLERSLASAFNQPLSRLTRIPKHPGNRFHISLEEGQTSAHSDDGLPQEIRAILTRSGEPTGFSFGFTLTFEKQIKYMIEHASLSVFQEVIGEPFPVFRADWDPLAAADANSRHAQPHWHFVQRPERIEEIVRVLLSTPVSEFNPKQQGQIFTDHADLAKFHFAMSPLWDKNQASFKQEFESPDFRKWFEALTSYVADQIEYLLKKAPANPREFIPSPQDRA